VFGLSGLSNLQHMLCIFNEGNVIFDYATYDFTYE
jgi:hypothetical protein